MISPNVCSTDSAVLKLAGAPTSQADPIIPATFVEAEGKRLEVRTGRPVTVSIPVTVEHEDVLFLGEVVGCTGLGEQFRIEIAVKQMLTGLQSLLALRSQLLGETAALPSLSQGNRLQVLSGR